MWKTCDADIIFILLASDERRVCCLVRYTPIAVKVCRCWCFDNFLYLCGNIIETPKLGSNLGSCSYGSVQANLFQRHPEQTPHTSSGARNGLSSVDSKYNSCLWHFCGVCIIVCNSAERKPYSHKFLELRSEINQWVAYALMRTFTRY